MNIKRLHDLRDSLDLSQNDIALVVKVSQQTYSSWETGEKIIPLKHLNTLANFYNVKIDYILGISNDKGTNFKNVKLDKKLIGNNLHNLRVKEELTLRSLANILNTTPSTIYAYETGKTLILTAFIYEIAKRFNTSIDVLIGRIDVITQDIK